MNYFPLYIDPGTGSLLFSIFIGAAAAVYFLFRTLLLKAKVFFSGGRVKGSIKNKFVIYAEDKRYWALFKPILEEFEKRSIELLYLTSSSDDPVFDSGFQYIKRECLGEGNKRFTRLNFLSADFVLATTPGLDVYQWKRSKNVKHYSHIVHAADEPVKYELFGIDYFDSILITGGNYQKSDIRKIEKERNLPEKQIITVGCPYLDEFAKNINRLPKKKDAGLTVLVSPSWGKSALLSRYGEKLLDPLIKTGWKIIVRPHPQSLIAEKEMIDRISVKYKENQNFEWDFKRENIYSINEADVMLSDFSGIILDFMFLRHKPVIYASQKMDIRSYDAFDIYRDHEEMWTFRTLKKTGIELKPELFDDLPGLILNASNNKTLETAIGEVKTEAWHYQGEAGKKVADFMIQTVSSFV